MCAFPPQCIPAISSLKPITTAVPLFFVLVMSAVKDGYDDFVCWPDVSCICASCLSEDHGYLVPRNL
jgi:hypothetical protein